MNEEFWKNAPKQFCENANIVGMSNPKGGEGFGLAMISGSNAQVYFLTPNHMKRFSQAVAFHVKKYEDEFGEINAEDWTPDMKSPLQIQDLGDDKKSGGK